MSAGLLVVALFAVRWVPASTFHVTPEMLTQVKQKYGEFPRRRVARWGEILEGDHNLPDEQKLAVVNEFFNMMTFVSDREHWGVNDYWATPLEFLETGAGDCEDFALAKYFTLRELGVPAERLRLTYVKALKLNQAHMVLTYYKTAGSEPLILDNLDADIRPASARTDLSPVYSFNGEGLWLAKQRGLGRFVGGTERLSMWRDLQERMQNEGLDLAR